METETGSPPTNHPPLIRETSLAQLAGSMSGEGWELILKAIQDAREEDKKELEKLYPLEEGDS